jgi:hypothetical protein
MNTDEYQAVVSPGVVTRMGSDNASHQIPPTAERVFWRAHVLGTQAFRAALESAGAAAPTRLAELHKWVERIGLTGEMESAERAFIDAPLGSLNERQLINASWRREGAAVLSWALERYSLPVYDQSGDGPDACNALGFLDPDAFSATGKLCLRPLSQLAALDELILNVHWRFNHFRRSPGKHDMERWAYDLSFGDEPCGQLRFINSDLAIGPFEFCDATEEQRRRVYSIVLERHRAANWLIGDDSVYSKVALDT